MLEIHPLTPERWDDLVGLFGERGAVGGCWCMWWRTTSAEFARSAGAANRRAMRTLVGAEREPGLLAYLDERPVGWCSVAPRAEFGRVERSRVLRPVDDRPAWSIVCFYIDRRHRGRGVAMALLRAAVAHAASRGAMIVEGYPVETVGGRRDSGAVFTGTTAMFAAAGFGEVARRSPDRPIMRYAIDAELGLAPGGPRE